MGTFENRMFRLLYKLTMEMDMGMSAALNGIEIDSGYLRKLHSDSVKNLKSTNSLLAFEQKVREREENSTDDDDQWQD